LKPFGGHISSAYGGEYITTPPTLFLFMRGDGYWASEFAIQTATRQLQQRGVKAAMVAVKPHPLDALTLHHYIEGFPPSLSRSFFEYCHQHGVLDRSDYFKVDPRRSELLDMFLLSASALEVKLMEPYVPAVREVLNVLYGEHEFTSEYFAETVLPWLKSHAPKSDHDAGSAASSSSSSGGVGVSVVAQ
jgi:hypothetical protein